MIKRSKQKDEINFLFCSLDETHEAREKKNKLTPSKASVEPSGKRLRTDLQQNLSGRFCKERAERLQNELKEHFVESPGKEASQESVPDTLKLTEKDKGLATRAVTKTFPSASLNRRKGAYSNIRKAISFEHKGDNHEEATLDGDSEIANVQALIAECRRRGKELLDDIIARVSAGDTDNIEALLLAYKREEELLTIHSQLLDKLYAREIQFLVNTNVNSSLSASEKTKLTEEVELLSKSLSFGLRSEGYINEDIFADLVNNVAEKFPFLFDIVKTLFPTDDQRKEKGAVHSLSLLMSLRNNKCKNDVTLVFTILLAAYGAGTRMVNMLNKIGLTLHWDTLMSFLDSYNKAKFLKLHSNIPAEKPIFLMLDNVNIHRGYQRHHRLFKLPKVNMWNFTVRGLLNPDISGIEDLFGTPETSLQSQDNVVEWDGTNVQLENCNEHSSLWRKFIKRYILTLLDDGLNKTPPHEKPISDMTEKECNQWLSHADYCVQQNVKISIPSIESIADTSMSTVKTDIHILPLSLENNATLTGTSAILDQFAEEFTLFNKVDKLETLPFDKKNRTFSLKKAREHVEFLTMLFQHRDEMCDLLKTLEANDKEFDSSNDNEDDEDLMDDCDDDNGTTIEQAKNRFAKCDEGFTELYNSIVDNVHQSKQNDSLERVIQNLRNINLDVRDHLGRTLLHMAVEQGNYDAVCCLMQALLAPDNFPILFLRFFFLFPTDRPKIRKHTRQ